MISAAAPTDLSGKRCFITGANGGIGKAMAEHFEELGASIYTTDIGDTFVGRCPSQHKAFDLLDNSDQSQYITAQTLSVDGGNVLR